MALQDKLTTKFQEALGDAQSLALGHDNAYIEPVHLLAAMLRQDDGPKALLQRVRIISPQGTLTPWGPRPAYFDYKVVGIFESNDAMESELWGDADVVGSTYRPNGSNSRSSVFARLTDAAVFEPFKASLAADPRLQVDVDTTANYFGKQSEGTTKMITAIGIVVGTIMAIGATSLILATFLYVYLMILPLAGGFLSGKYVRNQPPPAGVRLEKWKERLADFDSERSWRTLDAVNAVAREKETTAAAVSLAWLLAKPTVSSVIFGARSVEQLDDNLKGAEVKLTAEDVKRLDDASAFDLGYPYKFIANIQKRW